VRVRGPVGLRFPDVLVQDIDGLAQLIGAFWWLRVGLHRNHQILVSNPQVKYPIAETFTLVKPLGAGKAEFLAAYPEVKASRVIGGQCRDWLAVLMRLAQSFGLISSAGLVLEVAMRQQSRHSRRHERYPLSGVKRTYNRRFYSSTWPARGYYWLSKLTTNTGPGYETHGIQHDRFGGVLHLWC
jgi:hypothetical protein